jgi:hypothetical protein
MLQICAWCNKVISEGNSDNGISHGICLECKKVQDEELKKYKELKLKKE